MLRAYVGIISCHGLELLLPEQEHVADSLSQRIYNDRSHRAACCWAVLGEVAAWEVSRQLAMGNPLDALVTLDQAAVQLGPILPA